MDFTQVKFKFYLCSSLSLNTESKYTYTLVWYSLSQNNCLSLPLSSQKILPKWSSVRSGTNILIICNIETNQTPAVSDIKDGRVRVLTKHNPTHIKMNVQISHYASQFSSVGKMYLANIAITNNLSISFINVLQSTNKNVITGTMILNFLKYPFVQWVNCLRILLLVK
jgi:hypothetical protein